MDGIEIYHQKELLSYKTAFLIALATGAWGSELVILSCAPDNMDFKILGFRSQPCLH